MKLNRFRLLIFLSAVLTVTACKKDEENDPNAPAACFELPAEITAGTAVSFNSFCSKNALEYAWDFGDGNISSEANPSYTYSQGGTYNVELTITSEEGLTSTAVLEIIVEQPEIMEHSGDITQDETWAEGVHLITGDVNVENATLTIEPGAIVKFAQGTALYIAYGSSNSGQLIANGLADKAILFTSAAATPSSGDWDYIWFDDGTADASSMTYCVIEYGGGYNSSYGMVHLKSAKVNFNYNTIRFSASKGISLDSEASFKSFDNNAVKNNDLNPIEIYGNYAHTIGLDNDIESNTGILVRSDVIDQAEVTWKKQNVPYLIGGDVNLGSNTGSILNIDAGTTIAFIGGSAFYVGYQSGVFGTLLANGTASDPITFTSGSASKSEGDWDYIWFDKGTSSSTSLDYCIIEYGGGYNDNYGMIHIRDAEISITNSTLTNSQTYAISTDTEGSFSDFSNNTISDNAKSALSIEANYVHTIDDNNSIYSDRGIRVKGDRVEISSGTWSKQETFYLIDGEVRIGSETGTNITIAVGTELRFAQGASIYVGYGSGEFGNLIANGTASEPILFTSASPSGSESAGDWEFIWFDSGTGSATSMDYCQVLYGGGYNSSYGAIHCRGTGTDQPKISNTTVSHSGSYGISWDGNSTPDLSNMTYESNAQENEIAK